MEFPEPVIAVAVEPNKSRSRKMGIALQNWHKKTHLSELRQMKNQAKQLSQEWENSHLEIIVDRMKREFNVEANVGAPQVAYRECIRKPVDQESKFVRQSGGRRQYGHVYLKIEPTTAWFWLRIC